MGHDNPWRMAQTASLREEAQKRGYELVVTDAQDQTAKQVADVEDLIARRVDVILLAPREFEGLAPALLAAREADIPVILVDREAEGTPGEDFVTFLGSNFVEQGRRAAEWLVRETGGTAGIVELTRHARLVRGRRPRQGLPRGDREAPGDEDPGLADRRVLPRARGSA